MTEYRFALPQEEADVLDLINCVFSMAARPHDFTRLIPKVYAHPGFSALHAVAAENGRLQGTVAMLPVSMGGLRGGYIGSVSVHARYRGQGHMKALMAMQIEEAKKRGYDFLALGGQRQRYQHYGFENCGTVLAFSFTQASARHALPRETSLTLREADEQYLDDMAALHAQLPFACGRAKDRFLDTLRTYHGVPYVILRQGVFAGYLVLMDGTVTEMALREENDLPQALAALMGREKKCRVLCPGGWKQRALALAHLAEGCEIQEGGMMKVLRWDRVLSAAFQMKQTALPDGKRVIGIEGAGAFSLQAKNGRMTVSSTQDAPDRILEEKQAVALFFSPLPALLTEDPLLRAWLPLCLDIPIPDQF